MEKLKLVEKIDKAANEDGEENSLVYYYKKKKKKLYPIHIANGVIGKQGD